MLKQSDLPLYIEPSYQYGYGYTLYTVNGEIVCQIPNRDFKDSNQALNHAHWVMETLEHGAKNLQKRT